LASGYYLLLFLVCLAVYLFFQILFLNLNPFILLFLSGILLITPLLILHNLLKHNLYKELNKFAF
jgi:hypothetical protein